MTIALCTDSAACLPDELMRRFEIGVAPLTVTVEGTLGDDLSIDDEEFFDRLAEGIKPTTSQPSPGAFLQLYKQAAERGASEILSIHIGANLSGTVGSARIAAQSSPIPVEVVDSGTASFQQGLCVWEAAEALANGAGLRDAAEQALKAGASSGTIFGVGGLQLAEAGGRLRDAKVDGVPVLSAGSAGITPVGSATSVHEAVGLMTRHVAEAASRLDGQRLRVGVTHIHAPAILQQFKERLREIKEIDEIMDYSLVPSMAAHTGPGTVSAVYLPRPVR
jgi:DegV family protein with EDD domain